MNRYSDRARLVLHFAREEGSRLGHAAIGDEHLLLGLMREGGNACSVLSDFGASLEGLRRDAEELAGRERGRPRNQAGTTTPRARRVMEHAGNAARELGSSTIGTEHILLGIVREGDGAAYRILERLSRDVSTISWRITATAESREQGEVATEGSDSRPAVDLPRPNDDVSPLTEFVLGVRLVGRGVRHLRSSVRRLAERRR